ncbi:hypothetical protein SDJN03_21134, partial [Cucurbita argyrosperma subsp. sororia]
MIDSFDMYHFIIDLQARSSRENRSVLQLEKLSLIVLGKQVGIAARGGWEIYLRGCFNPKMLFFLSSFVDIVIDLQARLGEIDIITDLQARSSRENRHHLLVKTDIIIDLQTRSSRENRSTSELARDGWEMCQCLDPKMLFFLLSFADIIVKWKQKDSQIATRK